MPNAPQKDQYVWNAIIFILYPICIVGAFIFIDRMVGIQNMNALSLFDIIIISLATFRVIRLIAFDKIFGFGRAIFMDTTPEGMEVKPPKGFRRAMAELIECIWCTGVWAALLVLVLYMVTPFGRFGALILALAALGSFFQVVTRRIGSGTANHPGSPNTCA